MSNMAVSNFSYINLRTLQPTEYHEKLEEWHIIITIETLK